MYSERIRKNLASHIPQQPTLVLSPLVDQVQELTGRIKAYDNQIEAMAVDRGAELSPMLSVPGIGILTALSLYSQSTTRVGSSAARDVACFLGLQPKRSQSGDCDPRLAITKAGNCYARMLLVECAQHILGPFGRDSDLRRWGLNLSERGGKGPNASQWLQSRVNSRCCYTVYGFHSSNIGRSTRFHNQQWPDGGTQAGLTNCACMFLDDCGMRMGSKTDRDPVSSVDSIRSDPHVRAAKSSR